MYMAWKEKRNANDYSQMNFNSHGSKEIYIVDKRHVTILHSTLIRHPKLMKQVLFRSVQAVFFSFRVICEIQVPMFDHYSMPETTDSDEL